MLNHKFGVLDNLKFSIPLWKICLGLVPRDARCWYLFTDEKLSS